jgi:hypothetical protein
MRGVTDRLSVFRQSRYRSADDADGTRLFASASCTLTSNGDADECRRHGLAKDVRADDRLKDDEPSWSRGIGRHRRVEHPGPRKVRLFWRRLCRYRKERQREHLHHDSA